MAEQLRQQSCVKDPDKEASDIGPPFARALQRQIDLPVFSWGTFMDYANSVPIHRDDYGHF